MGMGMGMMSRGVVGWAMDGIELDSNAMRRDVNVDLAFLMSIFTDKNVVGYATSTVHLIILCKGNQYRQRRCGQSHRATKPAV